LIKPLNEIILKPLKMKMKAISTILLILFLATVLINCKREKPIKTDGISLEAELNLTQKQTSQFDSLYNVLLEETKLISADSNLVDKQEKTVALQKQMKHELMKILTPEQKKKFNEIMGYKPEK
jgi:hypothetical protein